MGLSDIDAMQSRLASLVNTVEGHATRAEIDSDHVGDVSIQAMTRPEHLEPESRFEIVDGSAYDKPFTETRQWQDEVGLLRDIGGQLEDMGYDVTKVRVYPYETQFFMSYRREDGRIVKLEARLPAQDRAQSLDGGNYNLLNVLKNTTGVLADDAAGGVTKVFADLSQDGVQFEIDTEPNDQFDFGMHKITLHDAQISLPRFQEASKVLWSVNRLATEGSPDYKPKFKDEMFSVSVQQNGALHVYEGYDGGHDIEQPVIISRSLVKKSPSEITNHYLSEFRRIYTEEQAGEATASEK